MLVDAILTVDGLIPHHLGHSNIRKKRNTTMKD